MDSLTQSPLEQAKQKLIALNQKARDGADALMALAVELEALETSDLWKSSHKSFPHWCRDNLNWSERYVRKLRGAGRWIASQKLLADSGEVVALPKSVKEANRQTSKKRPPGPVVIDVTSKVKENLSMPARLDTQAPSPAMTTPVPPPFKSKGTVEEKWKLLLHDLDWLSKREDGIPYTELKVICRDLFLAKEIRDELQPELPGVTVEPSKKRSRGTLEELITFFKLQGLTENDARYFFADCNSRGWKTNNQPIKDWQEKVIAWKLQGFFPSQKTIVNGKVIPKMPSAGDRELARLARWADQDDV